MTRNHRVFFAVGILFGLLFAAVSVQAAEEKSGNAAAERATEIFQWINFGLLIVAIVWAWDRGATPRLRRARERVGSAIAGATAAKAAADARLPEAETRLAGRQKEEGERATR